MLGYREWRQLWPSALYGRGQALEACGKHREAAAYYERIYLMYSHYRSWAAKAYLQRARCLRQSYMKSEAIETLQAMLKSGEFDALPEAAEARELLKALGGKENG